MQELQLTDQEQARRDKVLKLKELGIDPFGHAFKTNSNTQEIFKKYQDFSGEDLEKLNKKVKIAGRVVLNRAPIWVGRDCGRVGRRSAWRSVLPFSIGVR